ncbi:unannotated protein [freshwater metagenome]|uniref:Unannotated protein n=1 Tax=freshwater metagenome TaxID=449393 RepID=A0A6J7JRM3_9ZZZZ
MGLTGDGRDTTTELGLGSRSTPDHRAEDFHSGAVGKGGWRHHVAAGDPLEIVEVERYCLHLDEHLAGTGFGDRHGFEAQHIKR